MATWDFRETIYPLRRNTPPDPDTVKSAYENLKNALAEIRKEHDKAKEDLPRRRPRRGCTPLMGFSSTGRSRLIEQREFAAMIEPGPSPGETETVREMGQDQGEIFKVQERNARTWRSCKERITSSLRRSA